MHADSRRPAFATSECRRAYRPALWVLAALFAAPPAPAAAPHKPRIAIIIDDLGYGLANGRRAVELPGPVACAVLPGTPRAVLLADEAYAAGKEVLLHLPLQSAGYEGPVEPGAILLNMTENEVARSFAESLRSVPHVVGVNTHRGSLLTRHPGLMAWLMQDIEQQGRLFFIDSYTTAASVALEVARESGVPSTRRDVFLDPAPTLAVVEREYARLKKLARQRGQAVAIGHPHPTTLAFLERELPRLEDEGFELVSIGDYISHTDSAGHAPAATHLNPRWKNSSNAGASP